MTYTDANPTYQYNGEYYFHYDHSGNMCLLTDSNGNPAYSVEYDFYNGKITNQWNPYNLTNLLYQHGETGAFSLPLGMSQSIIGDDYIVIPPWITPPWKRPVIGLPVQLLLLELIQAESSWTQMILGIQIQVF